MYYPSAFFRAKAREALKGRWQTALLIALVVNLPTLLVQGIAAFTGNDPVNRLQSLVVVSSRDGVLTEQLLVNELGAFVRSTGFLTTQGLNLLAWVVTPCLALGMYKWLEDRLRGQDGPVSTVFCRVRLFLKALGLEILVILKVFLWTLPGIALYAVSMIPLFRAGSDPVQQASALRTTNLLIFPVLAAILVPGVLAALRYALSDYVMADRPETKIRACVSRSKELMKDNKKNLFFLLLSFLLWYLLEMLVSSLLSGLGSGILSLVFQMLAGLALNTYMACSVASFYLAQSEGVPSPAAQEPEEQKEDISFP